MRTINEVCETIGTTISIVNRILFKYPELKSRRERTLPDKKYFKYSDSLVETIRAAINGNYKDGDVDWLTELADQGDVYEELDEVTRNPIDPTQPTSVEEVLFPKGYPEEPTSTNWVKGTMIAPPLKGDKLSSPEIQHTGVAIDKDGMTVDGEMLPNVVFQTQPKEIEVNMEATCSVCFSKLPTPDISTYDQYTEIGWECDHCGVKKTLEYPRGQVKSITILL